jgi:hypothetical protein
MKEQQKKQLLVYIPASMHQFIKETAVKRGTTMAQLVQDKFAPDMEVKQ